MNSTAEKAGSEAAGELYPVSFAQQQLWFLDQLEPGTAVYNIPTVLRIRGALDRGALQRALDAILRRHEPLRTSIVSENGVPMQRIRSTASVPLPIFECQAESPAGRESEMRRRLEEEIQRPFDLQADLMIRAWLCQVSPDDHVLSLTLHHIAADEWSVRVLLEELTASYAAFAEGKEPRLPELPVTYVDFALWQRDWLQGAELQAEINYWKETLKGELPLLELPADRTRPSVQTHHGARRERHLGTELTSQLNRAARAEQVTLFTFLLAAFKIQVARYTRQKDLVIGAPFAGRAQVETEGLIGFFVNNIPIRTRLESGDSFVEYLRKVRDAVLSAQAHGQLPFDRLVEELQPNRSQSHSSVVQLVFTLQNELMKPAEVAGVKMELMEVDTPTAKFDLTVIVKQSESGLVVNAEYNTDLFDGSTIDRFLRQYETLLQSVVQDPHVPAIKAPLLSTEERRQLLEEWNTTETEYPRDRAIHDIFEEEAGKHPDAVALLVDNQVVTYAELDRRASRLAEHIRSFGLKCEDKVGIFLNRSTSMVVGLLAALKAGSAYVPLDPDYPEDRLEYMIRDAGVAIVITQPELLHRLHQKTAEVFNNFENVALLPIRRVTEPESGIGRDEAVPLGPEQLAYIMYTSGSTGQPKGVAVPHRAVVRLVKGTNYAQFGPEETFLQYAPLAFDASTFEIWGPLLNGGKLVIMPPKAVSLEELGLAIRQFKVTTLWLTTGLFHQMVEERLNDLAEVRHVMTGGEVLSVAHASRLLSELTGPQLTNAYGPTENTTFTTTYALKRGESWQVSIPIGRPISNSRVYILDEQLEPVPIGVCGELYAGGDGLAREYVNHPELTREKFIQNPFSNDPNDRLYRTGDLARYLPDGKIEFLGRLDHQVKVRGYRIELGEIEATLRLAPAVEDAAVLARQDQPGPKKLVAYWIARRSEPEPSTEQLRSHMQRLLPDYMVPSVFVRLDAFPLNANGKIDRHALPAPSHSRPELQQEFAKPRTPIEEGLAKIWQEVLALDNVGIRDDFFTLGGHSLLATQVIARINRTWNVRLPLRAIFEARTVEELSAQIAASADGQTGSTQNRGGIQPRLDRSQAQELLGKLDQLSEAEIEALLEQE